MTSASSLVYSPLYPFPSLPFLGYCAPFLPKVSSLKSAAFFTTPTPSHSIVRCQTQTDIQRERERQKLREKQKEIRYLNLKSDQCGRYIFKDIDF